MALRYEAWDLPTNATTFQRKIADLPVIERQGSGYLELNDGGEGQLALPDDYARLSEIISSTTGSLIRVYDGTTLVHEWTTERVDHDPEAGIVLISGPDIQALPAKAVVYPFDYPDQPTNDPDWHWGNADNLISNPSFENGVNFIANEGFEEGEVEPWWAGAVNGVDATLAIETTTIDTGSFSAKCTPLVSGGGMSTAVTGLQPSHDYTLSVRVNATAGNSIQLGASGPGGIAVVTGTGVAEVDLNTHEYEAQLDVTAAGGWETAQLVFTTAPGQTNTQVSIRNNTGSPALFYVDVVTLSGQGVGMEGWAISPWDANILITASTDVTPVTGTYTARVNAPDGGGIFTEVANVDNGAVYTVSAWGRTDSGTARWTLDVIDELFRRLGQDSIVLTTTFQQFSVQFTVPDDLPGEREVFFALRNDSGGADIAYFDDVEFYRGKAAANPGTILTDLFNDAQSDHAADTRGTVLTWLDISGFDSTNDSGATPWSSTLSFTAFAGDTYLNVLRNLAKLGYEWNITPKASPSPGLTHDLNVYEPDGLGTDYTAAASPAILTGGTTAARSVVERIPNYTAVLSVGGEGAYSEDSDATAETNFGRWETYARYIDTTSTTELATRAAEALADEAVNRSAVKVDVVRSADHPIPLVDYTVGDLLKWQVPGLVSATNKRVQRIAYKNTEPAEYQVTGSRVFPGESGLAEAVRVLLNRYDPLKRDRTARSSRPEVVGDGASGVPTFLVAASDAAPSVIAAADFVCDGTADEVQIQTAIDLLPADERGRVFLSEGTFFINDTITISNRTVHVQGVGYGTFLRAASSTVPFFQINERLTEISDLRAFGDNDPDEVTVEPPITYTYSSSFVDYNITATQGSRTHSVIRRCHIDRFGSGAVTTNAASKDRYLRIEDNIFWRCDGTNAVVELTGAEGDYITIQENLFRHNNTRPIQANANYTGIVTDNIFEGNDGTAPNVSHTNLTVYHNEANNSAGETYAADFEHDISSATQIATQQITDVAAPKAVYAYDSQAWFDRTTNRTYIAYLGLERDLYVTYYDHQDGTIATPVEIAAYPLADSNDHGSPSIVAAPDGHIHIVWGAHGSAIQYAKSTNKHDISTWTTGTLDADEGTYAQLAVTASGTLYVIARAGDNASHGTPFPTHSYGSIRESSDGGTTWTSESEIVDTTGFAEAVEDFYPIGGFQVGPLGYLHFVWTVARGASHDDTRTNIYHAYYDPADGTLYNAAGVDLGTSINSTEHSTYCLAATRNPIGQLSFGFNGNNIGIIYTANSNDVYVTVWDGNSWTETDLGVNAPSTEESRAAIWGDNGVWRAAVPVDNGTFGDVKLYGSPADGTDWTEIDTLLLGDSGEGYSRVGIVRNDGPIRALTVTEATSFATTSATSSDLQTLYALLDASFHTHDDRYYTKTLAASFFTGELLMQDGVTAPPVPIETEAQDDWLYEDITI